MSLARAEHADTAAHGVRMLGVFRALSGTICDSNADEFRQGTNRMTFTLFPTDIDVIRSENGWSLFLRKSLEG